MNKERGKKKRKIPTAQQGLHLACEFTGKNVV